MIVAITGATGFIGRRLVAWHLSQGDAVRVMTRKPLSKINLPSDVIVHTGDLVDQDTDLRSFVVGADVLYHCAGELSDASRMHSVHVVGTRNLVSAASYRIGHWVQLSSVGAYGTICHGTVNEQTPTIPCTLYEATKTEADNIVAAAGNTGGFTYAILRPSNVFGPDMPNKSLFQLISMIDRRLFFLIGAPGASANYIHVDNVVKGLTCCATISAAKGETYILSDYLPMERFVSLIAMSLGKRTPWLRIPEPPVQLVARVLGQIPGFPLKVSRVKALSSRVSYDIGKIVRELGYSHVVQIEDGLVELVRAWSERKCRSVSL